MRRRLLLPLIALCLLGCEAKKQPAPDPPPKATHSPVASAAPSAVPSAAPPAATESAASPEPEPESIAAQHVLIAYRGAKNAPRGVQRSKAEAKKLAEEVLAKARARADFSKLAETYSDDPTRTNRGNLGKFSKDKMVPEFAGPAFRLEEGEISDVVETAFGFHIIKRNQ